MTEMIDRLSIALAGRYKIERDLGEGGMATVHLAEDLKHDRKVALKVLRPELAAVLGAERFIQEIKTTASFQHPHILPLFDSGEADGFLYYVMPFIDGETLRDKLSREKQLGIEEAVRIASNVADALDYAHRNGVIHRDIKPENILMHDGRPMVADFGIALAVSAAGGERMTGTGLSVGTPNYMSPEQATADKDITSRSDIYALGSVLYEMLTGDPPHAGGSAQAIIMKIVTEEAPSVTKVRKAVPPNVAIAVAKSLEKLPADRFVTARDFAEALANPNFSYTGTTTAVAFARPAAQRSTVTVGLAAVALLASALAVWGWLRPQAGLAAPPVSRYSIVLPVGQGVPWQSRAQSGSGGWLAWMALSPDGSQLVYVGEGAELRVRSRDELVTTPLEGTEGAVLPFFSPDGEQVGFQTEGRLRAAPLRGGPPITISESQVGPAGAAWGSDGVVYADGARLEGLVRVRAPGAATESFTTLDTARGESDHQWPEALPNNRSVLFVIRHGTDDAAAEIGVANVATGEHQVLVRGLYARYTASGHLLYVTADGTLMARPFDQDASVLGEEATPVVRGLALRRFGPSSAPDMALSTTGTLVYVGGSATAVVADLVWLARDGAVREVEPGWIDRFRQLALSPDGGRLAVAIEEPGGATQVWIKQLNDGSLFKLTSEGLHNDHPVWTNTAAAVAFTSDRDDGRGTIYQQRIDGTPAERLVEDALRVAEVQFSDDGHWLAYRVGGGPASDIYVRRVEVDSAPIPTAASSAEEAMPRPSPDGRWLAYMSNETGPWEIWVRPMTGGGDRRWQVSTSGGGAPLIWAHGGRELFYRDRTSGNLVGVEITAGATFGLGARKVLFPTAGLNLMGVTPDDRRFLAIRSLPGGEDTRELIVVENFFEELREKSKK